MDELLQLLTQVLGDDHALVVALRQRVDGDAPWAEISAEDLDAAVEAIADVAADEEIPTETVVELADLRDELVAEQSAREEAAAEDERLRQEALARITGEDEGEDGDGEGDGDDTDGEDGDGDGDAEGEGDGGDAGTDTGDDGEGDAGDGDEGEGEGAETAEQPEPVTAATPQRPALADLARRRASRTQARPRANARSELALVAAAGVPDVEAGARYSDLQAFARALVDTWQAGVKSDASGRTRVGRLSVEYPDDRWLDGNTRENMRKIEEIQRQAMQIDYREDPDDALVAAGGLCAPTEVRYDLAGISEEDRPLTAALLRFGADRGGVRFIEPPTIDDLSDAITVWTEANDQSPSDPATKACLTVTCGTETEVVIDAIVKCLQFGNFSARTFPEQVDRWMQLARAQHARTAEDRLWNQLVANSTGVSTGQNLGAARDVLENVDQIVSAYRYRHRMNPSAPLVFAAPFWLRDMMRADLVRQLPGDQTMAVTDQQIQQWFTVRNVRPIWALDSGDDNDAFRAAQPAGAITRWPDTVEVLVFHEGAHLFLDGGELDLGVVRDSTLNQTNDFQMFAETFENTAFVGIESLAVTMDLCPDGASSGTVDIDPCTVGS